jgi:transcription elongation factor/antiterminator RfaH
MYDLTKHWYALYVRSRSEKKVLMQLEEQGIEVFLPLVTRLKQWSDRKKKVEEPLFKSYVFVHSNEKEHYPVLNVYGVVKFVTFEHKPVVVPDNQIIAIKRYIDDFTEEETNLKNTDLKEGQLVRIIAGPMMGLIGRLQSVKDKKRLTVYIEAVGQYISVSIPRTKIEPLPENEQQNGLRFRD